MRRLSRNSHASNANHLAADVRGQRPVLGRVGRDTGRGRHRGQVLCLPVEEHAAQQLARRRIGVAGHRPVAERRPLVDVAGGRDLTVTPLQQLFVLNSDFMVEQAKAVARGEEKTDEERIKALYRRLYGREARSVEST